MRPAALAETGEAIRVDLEGQGLAAILIEVPDAEEAKTRRGRCILLVGARSERIHAH